MTIKEYVEKIETVVSKQFDLDIDVIKSKSRVQELVDARDVLVYLLSKYLDFSITKISKYLGRTQASIITIMLKHDGYRIPGHSLRLPPYTNHVI